MPPHAWFWSCTRLFFYERKGNHRYFPSPSVCVSPLQHVYKTPSARVTIFFCHRFTIKFHTALWLSMVSYLSELQFDFLDSPVSSSPEYPALFNHFPSFGDSHLPVSMGIHDTDSSYSLDTGRSPLSPVSSVSSTSDVPKPVSGPSHSSSPPLKETGCSGMSFTLPYRIMIITMSTC